MKVIEKTPEKLVFELDADPYIEDDAEEIDIDDDMKWKEFKRAFCEVFCNFDNEVECMDFCAWHKLRLQDRNRVTLADFIRIQKDKKVVDPEKPKPYRGSHSCRFVD